MEWLIVITVKDFKKKRTYKHLLWECVEARRIWKRYNEYLCKIGFSKAIINDFDGIFRTSYYRALSIVKVKVIQEMIQME